MIVERFARRWQNRKEYQRVLNYTSGLQQMKPALLSEHLTSVINHHPQLQPHAQEIDQARAEIFSVHAGQERNQSGYPYHVHPERVALITTILYDVLQRPLTKDVFIAALKHDTVEDGPENYEAQLQRDSSPHVVDLVMALTRHRKSSADGTPGRRISHDEAAIKVRLAKDEGGLEDAPIIKTGDRIENVGDQPNVQLPPLRERLLYSRTETYKKSDYARWKRIKKRTKRTFIPTLLHDQPDLANVLTLQIKRTQKQINRRPRKSVFK